MTSRVSLLLVLPAACLLAQTPAPKPTSPKPAAPKAAARPAAKPVPAAAPAQPAAATNSATPASSPSTDKPILTIGTDTVTAAEFEAFINSLPAQYQTAARGPAKREIAEQYVQLRLLAQEARKKGLDQTPEMQRQFRFAQDNLLARAAYENSAKEAKLDEAELRKTYDSRKDDYENIAANHILIRFKGSPVPVRPNQKELTEEEALAKAQEVRKRLAAGEKFADVAKAESDDTGSGAAGGSLGTFGRSQMVKPFADAAFALPVGQVSEPVKTQFGYHIIQVTSHDTKSFDQVRTDLEGQLRPEAAKKALDALRQQSTVVFDDAYFPAPAPAPAAPAGAATPSAPKP